jgi:hypothetical protein
MTLKNSEASRMFVFRTVLLFACAALAAGTSYSQATRTWVSGVGDDVNPCSRTAPCKTFAGAISKTAAGGEINCLDPAGYGTVTITKSITLDCTGTFGSILSSGVNGIIINFETTPSDKDRTVRLRGLTLNGAGTAPGLTGVKIMSASNVTIENVVLDGFSQAAVNVIGPASVLVSNSTIRNNAVGISASEKSTVRVTRSVVTANKVGIESKGGSVISYKDNLIDGNDANGATKPGQLQ